MVRYPNEGRREAVCAWLTANGINPGHVPVDADMTIDHGPAGRFLRCEIFHLTPDGHKQIDESGDCIATVIVNVPLKTEPPEWWQPYQKPTREQLLHVLDRVQRLAEQWKYTADRKDGPRRELLQALGEHAAPTASERREPSADSCPD